MKWALAVVLAASLGMVLVHGLELFVFSRWAGLVLELLEVR